MKIRRRRAGEDGIVWGAVADTMTLVAAVFLIVFLSAMLSFRQAEAQRRIIEEERHAVEEKYARLVGDARERRRRAQAILTDDQRSNLGILPDGTLRLPENLLFAPGSAQLSPEGQRLVAVWLAGKVARVVAIPGQRVLIAGHTDAQPIGPSLRLRFASNWELSAHRATNVLRAILDAQTEIPAGSVYAAGFADTLPIAGVEPMDGRNRRVEVHLVAEERALLGDESP